MKTAHWTQRTHLFRADEYICSCCGVVCEKPYQVCPSCRSQMERSKYSASWVDEAEGLSAILDEDW